MSPLLSDKTLERINQFYLKFNIKDKSEKINGSKMVKLSTLLNLIKWQDLALGYPGRFHGDFHFENIFFNKINKKFKFLDWRQDFGGNINVGDIYYDLAKLLHGMIVSHEVIQKNNFFVKWTDNKILYNIKRKKILIEAEEHFNQWH